MQTVNQSPLANCVTENSVVVAILSSPAAASKTSTNSGEFVANATVVPGSKLTKKPNAKTANATPPSQRNTKIGTIDRAGVVRITAITRLEK